MKRSITIIVTCAGGMHIPNVITHLQQITGLGVRVIATDVNHDAVGQYFADRFYRVPGGMDRTYPDTMLDLCRREGVDIIIPFSDEEALSLAQHRDSFAALGCTIIGSCYEATRIAGNKLAMLQHLRERGVPTPAFYSPRSLADVHQALTELGYPHRSVVFKPISGRGARGFRIICDHFDEWEHMVQNKKETFLSLARLCGMLKDREPFPDFLLMEYLEGNDFNIDVLMHQGRCRCVAPQQRLVPDHGPVEVGLMAPDERIARMVERVAAAFDFDFLVNIEMAYQQAPDQGALLPYEINVRASAPIITTAAAGCSLIEGAVFQALNREWPVQPISLTKMIRYWNEIFLNP